MFCTHCGAHVSADARFCTSCGQPIITAERTVLTPKTPKKFNKKWLFLLCLLVPLLIWGVISIYNNSGTFQNAGNGVRYHGSLSQLYEENRSELEEFIQKQCINGKECKYIKCNDYYLSHDDSVVDIYYVTDGKTVIYKTGLVECEPPSKGEYYERFIDYSFSIKASNHAHKYYFCSLSDVLKWIELNH